MKPPPSLEDLIASVEAVPLAEALEWLADHGQTMRKVGARYLSPENLQMSADDVQRRYRLLKAKQRLKIVQGVG